MIKARDKTETLNADKVVLRTEVLNHCFKMLRVSGLDCLSVDTANAMTCVISRTVILTHQAYVVCFYVMSCESVRSLLETR